MAISLHGSARTTPRSPSVIAVANTARLPIDVSSFSIPSYVFHSPLLTSFESLVAPLVRLTRNAASMFPPISLFA